MIEGETVIPNKIDALRQTPIISSLTQEEFEKGLAAYYVNTVDLTDETIENVIMDVKGYNERQGPRPDTGYPYITFLSEISLLKPQISTSDSGLSGGAPPELNLLGISPEVEKDRLTFVSGQVTMCQAICIKALQHAGLYNENDILTRRFKPSNDANPLYRQATTINTAGQLCGIKSDKGGVSWSGQDNLLLSDLRNKINTSAWEKVPPTRQIEIDVNDADLNQGELDKTYLDVLKKDFAENYDFEKIEQQNSLTFVNNAADASKFGSMQNTQLCPQTSVIDSQSICNTSLDAALNKVLEYGTQDIEIKSDPEKQGQAIKIKMRIRMTPVFKPSDRNEFEVCNGKNERKNQKTGLFPDELRALPEYVQTSYYLEIGGVPLANMLSPEAAMSAVNWPNSADFPANTGILSNMQRADNISSAKLENTSGDEAHSSQTNKDLFMDGRPTMNIKKSVL